MHNIMCAYRLLIGMHRYQYTQPGQINHLPTTLLERLYAHNSLSVDNPGQCYNLGRQQPLLTL